MNLESYISSLLLRYLRQGRKVDQTLQPNINLEKDLEYLRLNWSVSSAINNLCNYLIEHRFELQASTEYLLVIDDINIRGRLDATKTMLLRKTSGHPTKVAYYSSRKSYAVGPNQVLAWVLSYSYNYARRWIDLLKNDTDVSNTNPRYEIRKSISLLAEVHRISLIKETVGSSRTNERPTRQALQQAKTSRKKLYRLAYEAYVDLQGIERGKSENIKALLEETLIKPKEDYQILELAMALSLAQAVSDRIRKDVILREMTLGGESLVIIVGDVSISWQSKTDSFQRPALERSEVLLESLLPLYFLSPSSDRPDIIVRNESTRAVIAIGEAKSFGVNIDAWRDPVRKALAQIIRYSRGYATGSDQEALISRSCIGLTEYPQTDRPTTPPVEGPIVFDVSDIFENNFQAWIDRVLPFIQ